MSKISIENSNFFFQRLSPSIMIFLLNSFKFGKIAAISKSGGNMVPIVDSDCENPNRSSFCSFSSLGIANPGSSPNGLIANVCNTFLLEH